VRILVTVDRSPLSEAVLEPVARLALPLEAEVHLVTVVRPSKVHDTPPTSAIRDLYPVGTPSGSLLGVKTLGEILPHASEDREQAIERCGAEAQAYLQAQSLALNGLVVTTHVLFDDDPAEAIIAFARREHVDLIAMATHGRTGLGHLLAGSVCERVIRGGVAAVMALRPPATRES
jgi:nucleotide-binding universal stress UspA family protein